MPDAIHFLPWMRQGLGLGIDTAEPVTLAPLARAASFTASVTLDAEAPIQRQMSLRPPDQVVAIDKTQIARRYPAPGVTDAEYGYFPHIEFTTPDLPWMLSPASEDSSSARLRPWIVLVCIEASRATLETPASGSGQLLRVAADDLPDLNDSHAWAHVQSAVPANQIADVATTGAVISRLLCPRELAPNTRYMAALVNAWTVRDAALHPAWSMGEGDVALTVYDSWMFTTAQVSSFEELAERLAPVSDDTLEFGIHPVDITALGLTDPWTGDRPVRAYYRGAIADALSTDVLLKEQDGKDFAEAVAALVEQGTYRRVLAPNAPDPVVAPMAYGAFARGHVQVQGSGWMPELNIVPSRRFAAGLGAALVRKHQERFMATAWDQAGELRETNRLHSEALLRQSTAETHRRRALELDPVQALSVLGPQLSFIRLTGEPVKKRLNSMNLPNGFRSPAMQRALRPSGLVARSFRAPLTRQPIPGQERPSYSNRRNISETVSQTLESRDARAALRLSKPRTPGGMRRDDPRRVGGGILSTPGPTQPSDLSNLSVLQSEVGLELQPRQTARTQLLARVPALAALPGQSADGPPGRASSGPVFSEPLSVTLMETSTDLIMPGATEFPDNSVRMLVADSAFVAAFLAGANHEMIRELIWREYPARLTHTSFRRFWARPDPAETDIDPIDHWDYIRPLEFHGAAGGESAILMVRGDLLRQYPSVRFLLLDPGQGTPVLPSFSGVIPPDTAFYGFDVDKDAVTAPDSTWQVIIEEPPQEPRFGLDTGPPVAPLTTYSELTWGDLKDRNGPNLSLQDGAHLKNNSALQTEATWGLNGAHMALATLQKPFRLRMRVVDLLGGD